MAEMAEENGQDGIYAKDECRCDDPFGLFWCHVHNHLANHDGRCLGRCYEAKENEP